MAIISIPKTPPQAYNPDRPAGILLQHQLEHLEWAVRPAGQRSPEAFRFQPAATEREAATRIEALTLALLQPEHPTPAAGGAARPSRVRRAGATRKRSARRASRRVKR